MRIVHILIASSGQYDDQTDWPVTAYTSKEIAERALAEAKQRNQQFQAAIGKWREKNDAKPDEQWESFDMAKWLKRTRRANIFKADENGSFTHYHLAEIELVELKSKGDPK